ncbi:hypothetical protein MKEN_01147700 [Mycena kentingensis (nom. inval.)]|nr:hypothetical protein MKEN_01147700 [Mycena kentingensis (nom. inval.)]
MGQRLWQKTQAQPNMPLERAPADILQHIAFLSAPRTLYGALNGFANPHLYASIFRLQYGASTRTDSSLAAELRHRCAALGRCRRLDMSSTGLRQHLWTLLWLTLENEFESGNAGGGGVEALKADRVRDDDLACLVVWLLCLGLSRQDILSQPAETRNALVALLRPLVSNNASRAGFTSPRDLSVSADKASVSNSTPPPTPSLLAVAEDSREEIIYHYNAGVSTNARVRLPPPSDAAIILIFALKEATPLQIPYHLPATRALALAANPARRGPTAEDYTNFQRALTLLYSDIRNADSGGCVGGGGDSEVTARSSYAYSSVVPWTNHWQLLPTAAAHCSPAVGDVYPPGSLAGVWDGSMMISSCGASTGISDAAAPATDFLCRTPMQCQLSEHRGSSLEALKESSPAFSRVLHLEDLQQPDNNSRSLEPNAIIALVGQTLLEHEEAWGSDGFVFAGTVQQDDGTIVFTRRPKYQTSENSAEAWVFVGRLCYGNAFVGTFRSSEATETCGVQGIFSLRKRPMSPKEAGGDE